MSDKNFPRYFLCYKYKFHIDHNSYFYQIAFHNITKSPSSHTKSHQSRTCFQLHHQKNFQNKKKSFLSFHWLKSQFFPQFWETQRRGLILKEKVKQIIHKINLLRNIESILNLMMNDAAGKLLFHYICQKFDAGKDKKLQHC
jgi:hypothetical protein